MADDGLPTGSTVTQWWTVFSGPGTVSFSNPTSVTTTATFSLAGVYVLQLTASDTQLTGSAQTTVTVLAQNQPPVMTLPGGLVIQLPATALLPATVTDDGLPLGSTVTVTWSKVSGPGTVTFANPASASTTASFSNPGTYVLQLVASDTQLSTTGQTSVIVLPPAAPPPTVQLLSPADGLEITQPTGVTANVSNGAWQLQYALYNSSSASLNWVTIATGAGAVNGAIATFDPTLLLNGTYQLRLTSTDNLGQTSTATTTVTVARNMKVGVFSLAFNDLTVPLTGLPITITRSYDSRDKGVGDFGVGWRLSLSSIRLQKNRSLGLSWFEDVSDSLYTPQWCVTSTNSKLVTIAFPDGTVYKFQATMTPQCQTIESITNATLSFTQTLATAGTAGATLAPVNGGAIAFDGTLPGVVNALSADASGLYDPTTFRLTLANGVSYVIDQTLGVTSITDTNGNTLTINSNGITSSTGVNVPFVRDSQGRITKITDPNSKSLTYTYNGADLASVTDRQSNTTTSGYAPGDYLNSITTPNGVQALTNSYDSSGRLTGSVDGLNGSISYNHNIQNRTETVSDRMG